MTAMKVHQQPAFVLHTRPYSETSLLVDVFSCAHGRLTLMAKGARRGKARTRGVLSPFQQLLLSWSGKSQLPTLTHAETQNVTPELRGEYLASGFYLNELLLRLLHRFDAHESLFSHYAEAIAHLAAAHPTRAVLRIFEKRLLRDIGFGVVLDCDAETGEAIDLNARYHYILEKGPVRLPGCVTQTPPQGVAEPEPEFTPATRPPLPANALVLGGDTLRALVEERFSSDTQLREAYRLTRTLIDRQLNGRGLRTRRVATEMNRYHCHAE